MKTLVHIKSSPRAEKSRSNTIAQTFIRTYKKNNPADEVIEHDLFALSLPKMDSSATGAKYAIIKGQNPTEKQAEIWGQVEKVIEAFLAADKYLLSTPMWNFSIPYRLKHYIDVITQPGYTFTVSEKGYEGLVKARPICIIYSRGGTYLPPSPAEAMDLQKPYLEMIFKFMGFTEIKSIICEPTLADNDTVETAMEQARRQAEMIAASY